MKLVVELNPISRLKQINFMQPTSLAGSLKCGRRVELRQTFLCLLYHRTHMRIGESQDCPPQDWPHQACTSQLLLIIRSFLCSVYHGMGPMQTRPISVELPQTKDIFMLPYFGFFLYFFVLIWISYTQLIMCPVDLPCDSDAGAKLAWAKVQNWLFMICCCADCCAVYTQNSCFHGNCELPFYEYL